MSFWNEDHPMQWKYDQVQDAIPAWGVSNNEKFSDSTNEDLTEAANLINLVYDYYNNGSLGANIDVRLSRYKEECKNGAQICSDWFEQVKYWYDNDCMPSDDEQEWHANYWMETMLNCIDFEYDESKNPVNIKKLPKRKRNIEVNESCKLAKPLRFESPKPAMPDLKKVQETFPPPIEGHICEPKSKKAKNGLKK